MKNTGLIFLIWLIAIPVTSMAQTELPHKPFESYAGDYLGIPYKLVFHRNYSVFIGGGLRLYKQTGTQWQESDRVFLPPIRVNRENGAQCSMHEDHVISIVTDKNDGTSFLHLFQIVNDRLIRKDSIEGKQFMSPMISGKYIAYLKSEKFNGTPQFTLVVLTYENNTLKEHSTLALPVNHNAWSLQGVLAGNWIHLNNLRRFDLMHVKIADTGMSLHSQKTDLGIPCDTTFWGWSFDATESWVVAGCHTCTTDSSKKGLLITYKYNNGTDQWEQHSKIENHGAIQDGFGFDATIEGNTLFAPGPDFDTFYVDRARKNARTLIYRYQFEDDKWQYKEALLPHYDTLGTDNAYVYLEGIHYDGYSLMASIREVIIGGRNISYSFDINRIPGSIEGMTPMNGSLWPNPVTEQLHYDFNGSEPMTFSVLNIKGQIVMQGTLHTSTGTCDFSKLEPGLYLIQLTSNKGRTWAYRITKE